jgi:hypothetical protein
MKRRLRYLAIVIGIAAIGVIWLALRWDYIRIRPVNRAAEQDAVYEAVMRYVTQSFGNTGQPLRFDSRVESADENGISYSRCLASRRRNDFPTTSLKPQYDTFADRLYRFVARRPYDFRFMPKRLTTSTNSTARPAHSRKRFEPTGPRNSSTRCSYTLSKRRLKKRPMNRCPILGSTVCTVSRE